MCLIDEDRVAHSGNDINLRLNRTADTVRFGSKVPSPSRNYLLPSIDFVVYISTEILHRYYVTDALSPHRSLRHPRMKGHNKGKKKAFEIIELSEEGMEGGNNGVHEDSG
jgi:hypothetical protein